jgi:hypothetical protein
MMKLIPFLVFGTLLFFSGCLSVKQKEYHIRLRTDHSGDATIKFIDIASETDDSVDVSRDDFRQLIEFYLEGTGIEMEHSGFRNVTKRLFEDDGVLSGEIHFTFDSLAALRLFKYDSRSPLMYFTGGELASEWILETNGKYGGETMPVVFWPGDATELYLKTRVVSEAPFRRGLLSYFRLWEEGEKTDGPAREPHRDQ